MKTYTEEFIEMLQSNNSCNLELANGYYLFCTKYKYQINLELRDKAIEYCEIGLNRKLSLFEKSYLECLLVGFKLFNKIKEEE